MVRLLALTNLLIFSYHVTVKLVKSKVTSKFVNTNLACANTLANKWRLVCTNKTVTTRLTFTSKLVTTWLTCASSLLILGK
jgi:hypothetical protein